MTIYYNPVWKRWYLRWIGHFLCKSYAEEFKKIVLDTRLCKGDQNLLLNSVFHCLKQGQFSNAVMMAESVLDVVLKNPNVEDFCTKKGIIESNDLFSKLDYLRSKYGV